MPVNGIRPCLLIDSADIVILILIFLMAEVVPDIPEGTSDGSDRAQDVVALLIYPNVMRNRKVSC